MGIGNELVHALGSQAAASVVVTALDKLEELSTTELGYINDVTPGTFTASKALIPSAAGAIAGIPKVSTGTSTPVSAVTPSKAGDIFIDTNASKIYVSVSAASSSWQELTITAPG